MSTGTRDIKSKLVAVIEQAEADQAALRAEVSDVEKMMVGAPDHWTVKDQIAHLNFWRGVELRKLIALRDGAEPPADIEEDDDVVNERNFRQHQHTPWGELIDESERLLREAKQIIGQLTEAQLAEPVWETATRADHFVMNILEHPSEHLAQIYEKRGDLARASEQEHATVQVIGDLLGRGTAIYGYAVYNLGCYYAHHGDPTAAIAAVGEALSLIPALVERSQQDPDLDSLRALPAFQALYTG